MKEKEQTLSGYLRIWHILGDPEANPPILPIIPLCKSAWWKGVKSGQFPQPVKIFGKKVAAWRTSEIEELLESIEQGVE